MANRLIQHNNNNNNNNILVHGKTVVSCRMGLSHTQISDAFSDSELKFVSHTNNIILSEILSGIKYSDLKKKRAIYDITTDYGRLYRINLRNIIYNNDSTLLYIIQSAYHCGKTGTTHGRLPGEIINFRKVIVTLK